MDLYTLDSDFLKKDVIDSFVSVIWTERFTAMGEVKLSVDASADMKTKLAPGTFLSLEGTDEVMILETQSMDDGVLQVEGTSLLGVLKNRFVYRPRDYFSEEFPRTVLGFAWSAPGPGQPIINLVETTAIDPPWPDYGVSDDPELQLDWASEIIPNLSIDPVSYEGVTYTLVDTVAPGTPVYEIIEQIAKQHNVGVRLYLDNASAAGYSLKFLTYLGEDRTSDQALNEVVRFSPYSDSLTNLKSVHSIASYKNVAYAQTGTYAVVEVVDGIPTGLDRRSTFVSPTIEEGTSEIDAAAILQAAALNALANSTVINIFDGEVTAQNLYLFGTHYGLGDLVELESIENTIQKVRITEYIRAQDNAGERAYPTVSVVV